MATSQIATQNLAGLGLESLNTSRFLMAYQPGGNGQVRERLAAGDLQTLGGLFDIASAELARERHHGC